MQPKGSQTMHGMASSSKLQAPLRLRTGVLLYGPPGCGKTHVVSAAVAAANVRCITVSGPELLNKYIGTTGAGSAAGRRGEKLLSTFKLLLAYAPSTKAAFFCLPRLHACRPCPALLHRRL